MGMCVSSKHMYLTDPTLTRKTSSESYKRSYRKLTQVDGLKMLRR